MKVSFIGNVKDFDGTDILADKEPVVLLNVALVSLRNNAKEPNGIDGTEHMKRHTLAKRIYEATSNGRPADLVAEDVVLLKRKVADSFITLVAGPVIELLEAAESA